MRSLVDESLLPLIAETNDQRRAVGRVLWYLHRSLVFWIDRSKPFGEILAAWAPACAQVFATLENRFRKLEPHARDERLRRYLADVLRRLCGDLSRGDRMAVPFLRWLEGRFPALTSLMREEGRADPAGRSFDLELVRDLRWLFGELSISSPSGIATHLSRASSDLLRP